MTNQEIKTTGQTIAQETQIGGNTAGRVGGVIEGIGVALDNKDAASGYYQATINGGSISVNAPNYVLGTGGNLRIKMPAAGTTASTLTIGNANAVQLWYNGAAVSAQNTWEQDEIISVFYDGTRFMASNSQGGGGAANKIAYDNSQSGLAADNVQEAIDEVNEIPINISTDEPITVTPSYLSDKKINESGTIASANNNGVRYIPVSKGDVAIITITHTASKEVSLAMFTNAPVSGSTAIEGTYKTVNTVAGEHKISYVAPTNGYFAFSTYNSGSYTLELATNKASVIGNFVPFLKGKKISLMGNSRCTFNGYIPSGNATKYPINDVTTVNQTWWWKVINALGAELELNNSYSGGRVTTVEPAKSYITIYNSYGLGNPDVIFLWGGINDLRNSAELGELNFDTPTANLDKTTFAGAMDYLVRTIISEHPNAYIVMFVEDCLSFNEAWVQVIYDIANHYYVPRWEVNSANKGGIIGVVDLSNLMSEAKRFDSLHYNAEGMQTIASETLKKLASMGSEDVNTRINTNSVSVLDKVAQYCCVQDIVSTYNYTSGNITSSADYTRAFIPYNIVKGKRYRITVDFGTLVVSQTRDYALYLRLSDRNVTSDSYRVRQLLKLILPLEMVTTVIDFTAEISVPYLEYQLNKVTSGGSGSLGITIQELGQVTGAIEKSLVTENCEIVRNFDGWDAAGTWQVAKVTRAFVIPVREYHAYVDITAGANACYYAFWKEHPQKPANSGSITCYCNGKSRESVAAGRTKSIPIPDDCKYVYIGMINKDSSVYTPSSVRLKYAARDNVEWIEENNEEKFFPYKYNGGSLKLSNYGLVGKCGSMITYLNGIGSYSSKSQQSLAIYGDYVFSFYDTGYVQIYHLPTETLIASFLMANTISGANNHCGNANFGSQFYAATDVFPCLYLSSHGEYKAYVLRIVPAGTDANGHYTFDATSITLIQIITGASSWGIHFYPDGDKLLVHKNTSYNQHFYVFDMPSIAAGDVTLNTTDAVDEFEFNVGLTQAGAVVRNGLIFVNMYSTTAYDAKRSVYIFDYIQHNIRASLITPLYYSRAYEVEGIEVYDGAIWLSHNGGNFLSKITFG